MSKYTTGELAKLCGVSVRTVQYYDTRKILIPSELSEGGRRLYSEEDLKRMKIICFLRELDIPINTIGELFAEENPENVIEMILQQQAAGLRKEIDERQEQLRKLELLQKEIKTVECFSVESIGDIAYVIENKKILQKIHAVMLIIGIPLEFLEWCTFFYGCKSGIWWPYVLGMILVITGAVGMSWYYFKHIEYICPNCHRIFKPKVKDVFWAAHTPTTRKLTCCHCGYKGYCVEIADK